MFRVKTKKLSIKKFFYIDITDKGKELDIYEYWTDKSCQSYVVEAGETIDEGLVLHNAFTAVDTEGNSNITNEFQHEQH